MEFRIEITKQNAHRFTNLDQLCKTKTPSFLFSHQGGKANYTVKTLEVYTFKTLEVYTVKTLEVYTVKTLDVYILLKSLEVIKTYNPNI